MTRTELTDRLHAAWGIAWPILAGAVPGLGLAALYLHLLGVL